VVRGLVDDQAQIVETIDAGDQRTGRLEAHIALGQVRIGAGDIRRVANDQLEALTLQRTEPMTAQHGGVVQVQALAIALGQRDGFLHAIHGGDLPRRALAGQGQGNCAAAGAQVEHPGRGDRQQLQRGLYQQLGVRARDQGVRCDFQVELPETLLAQNIGHRLAATTALQVPGKFERRFTWYDALRPGVQKAPGLAQGRSQQQLCVQARGGRVR